MGYLQAILDGLLQGGVFACVAVGLSLVFGVMRIINWSHGETLMISMYVSFFMYTFLGVHPYICVLINAIIFFGYGFLLQSTALNNLLSREKDREPMSILLFTAGIGMVLTNGALMLFGGNSRSISGSFDLGTIDVSGLGIVLSLPKLIAFVISIAFTLALFVFLQKTETGRALRATAQNRSVSQLMGINVKKIYGIAMGIGLALVGVAGALLITFFPVTPDVGTVYSLRSFIIVVLGGKGSVPGALLGGLIVGVVETLGAQLTSQSYAQVMLFVLFVLILLFRPAGLLSKESE